MNLNKEQKEVLTLLINKQLNDFKTGFDTNILCEIKEAINYSRCCKPKGNCKITVLVTYEILQDSGSAYFDDYKVTRTKIVQVENLEDINEMFTNIVDVKIVK